MKLGSSARINERCLELHKAKSSGQAGTKVVLTMLAQLSLLPLIEHRIVFTPEHSLVFLCAIRLYIPLDMSHRILGNRINLYCLPWSQIRLLAYCSRLYTTASSQL